MIHQPLCFFHSADLDGHCSGWLVQKYLGTDVKLIGIDYGDPFPWELITDKDQTVYMVDFSLQPKSQMLKLADMCQLVWIDHHKSAIEALVDAKIHGLRDTSQAACELVWDYLKINLSPDQLSMPDFVYYLGRYDIWDHSNQEFWDDIIYPFQMGMRLKSTIPTESCPIWAELFEQKDRKLLSLIIAVGTAIVAYQTQQNRRTMNSSFDVELDGLRCLAVNAGGNSQIFESKWDSSKYDAMLGFKNTRGEFWTVSLYSDKDDVDVSVIAKNRGGGGHKGAAGFQCKELPFTVSKHLNQKERRK